RSRHEHVEVEPNELGSERGEPLLPVLGKPPLEDHVASFHVAEFAQPLLQRLDEVPRLDWRRGEDQADPVDLPGLLRLDGRRRGQEREGERGDGQSLQEPTSRWPGCYADRAEWVNLAEGGRSARARRTAGRRGGRGGVLQDGPA